MNDLAKNLMLWLIVALVLMMVFKSFSAPVAGGGELTYNQFISEVKSGRVSEVNIDPNGLAITGKRRDGSVFTTSNPRDDRLVEQEPGVGRGLPVDEQDDWHADGHADPEETGQDGKREL